MNLSNIFTILLEQTSEVGKTSVESVYVFIINWP
jgi:hypothetical protein